MTWNGYPLDEPGRDARERSMWAMADEFSTRAIERERDAIRERDANLGDERRRVIAELDQWWQRELESSVNAARTNGRCRACGYDHSTESLTEDGDCNFCGAAFVEMDEVEGEHGDSAITERHDALPLVP